jgi:3-methyladenine DNA glycosylase AlkD
MTFEIIYQDLLSYSNTQTYKTYKKHGANDKILGIKLGSIRRLKKKYKTNHAVALELWDTSFMEARLLACLLADPKQMTSDLLDKWVHDIDFYYLSEIFANNLVVKADFALEKAFKWADSSHEYVKRTAYDIISFLCKSGKTINNDTMMHFLDKIEEEIMQAPNRAKQSMNIALINIGKRNEHLLAHALKVAKKIGELDLDLGETNCKNYNAYQELNGFY